MKLSSLNVIVGSALVATGCLIGFYGKNTITVESKLAVDRLRTMIKGEKKTPKNKE